MIEKIGKQENLPENMGSNPILKNCYFPIYKKKIRRRRLYQLKNVC